MSLYESGPEDFIAHLVTGDDTWLYQWDPEAKQLRAVQAFGVPPLRKFSLALEEESDGDSVLGRKGDPAD